MSAAVSRKSTSPERQRRLPLLLALLIAALTAFLVISEIPVLFEQKAVATVTTDGTAEEPFLTEDDIYIEPSGEVYVEYTVDGWEHSALLLDPPRGVKEGDRLTVVCDDEHPESVSVFRPLRGGLLMSALIMLVAAYIVLWQLHDHGVIE